jgi:hypothetical protein
MDDRDRDLLNMLRLRPEDGAAIAGAEAEKPARKRRPRETRPFVHMLEDEYVAGADALGCQQLSVWVFILRQWRVTGEPVAVTNVGLKKWHVGRNAKYAALKKLAEAGLIRVVEGRFSCSPRVVPTFGGVPDGTGGCLKRGRGVSQTRHQSLSCSYPTLSLKQ